jgi:hypothetical protein
MFPKNLYKIREKFKGIYGPAVAGMVGGSAYNILGPANALVNLNQELVV